MNNNNCLMFIICLVNCCVSHYHNALGLQSSISAHKKSTNANVRANTLQEDLNLKRATKIYYTKFELNNISNLDIWHINYSEENVQNQSGGKWYEIPRERNEKKSIRVIKSVNHQTYPKSKLGSQLSNFKVGFNLKDNSREEDNKKGYSHLIDSYNLKISSNSSCLANEFRCANSSQCIKSNQVCSGVPDCPDGSDENLQLCGCLKNEFRCDSNCIDKLMVCDTVQHCSHGEDEKDCDHWPCSPPMHFKCGNGYCISPEQVCDFVDNCGDGSDEQNCQHRSCYYPEFRCSNGECIRPAMVCDGETDCTDGSDELLCDDGDFVNCEDGGKVHRFYWCDDWPDCSDNQADEANCSECDVTSQFECSNSRCVAEGNVCDGYCDCSDCTDETTKDCSSFYSKKNGILTCSSGSTVLCVSSSFDRSLDRCIAERYLCDDVVHCHGKDTDEIFCNASKQSNVPDSTLTNLMPSKLLCPVKEDLSDLRVDRQLLPYEEAHHPPPSRFQCSNEPRHLPITYRCDHIVDCLYGEDELNCDHTPCNSSTQWTCDSGQCVQLEERCDNRINCYDKTDEIDCHSHPSPHPCGFRCSSGQCLPRGARCDHWGDCLDGSDEKDCGPSPSCSPSEFSCSTKSQCIPPTQRCVIGGGGEKWGCVDGSHLIDCKSFTCPLTHHKCLSGPCLDQSRVCDGRIDCPDSWDDEDQCPFRCSSSAPLCSCHHITVNCSGLRLTEFPDVEPQITMFEMSHNFLGESLAKGGINCRSNLIYLDLSFNDIENISPGGFNQLWRLKILILSHNNITSLKKGGFEGLLSLRTLHLNGNQIRTLHPYSFYGLATLPQLDLSSQAIESIAPLAFMGLRNLTSLVLSNNLIETMEAKTFLGLNSLQVLEIENNPLSRLDRRVFQPMPLLSTIGAPSWQWCCLATHIDNCKPTDEFSSCEDLMSNYLLRICIWLLGLLSLIGNTFVISWRLSHHSGSKPHSFLIINMAMGDLLMGVYLLIIAGVDMHYRGMYEAHEQYWRSSNLCQFAGFISTLSAELSVITLTVITVDRLLVIKFPFGEQRLNMRVTVTIMLTVWVLVTTLAALPLLDIPYFDNFYGRSGVCLALHITSEKPNGWEYSVFIFLVINLVSFAVIAMSYALMYTTARQTQRDARRSSATGWSTNLQRDLSLRKRGDSWNPLQPPCYPELALIGRYTVTRQSHMGSEEAGTLQTPNLDSHDLTLHSQSGENRDQHRTPQCTTTMGRRMTLIVATDAACWLPIIALGVVSLCGVKIPSKVFSWIAVFILPLNAAVNPILYTLSTSSVKKTLQEATDPCGFCCHKTRSNSRSTSCISLTSMCRNSFRRKDASGVSEFVSIEGSGRYSEPSAASSLMRRYSEQLQPPEVRIPNSSEHRKLLNEKWQLSVPCGCTPMNLTPITLKLGQNANPLEFATFDQDSDTENQKNETPAVHVTLMDSIVRERGDVQIEIFHPKSQIDAITSNGSSFFSQLQKKVSRKKNSEPKCKIRYSAEKCTMVKYRYTSKVDRDPQLAVNPSHSVDDQKEKVEMEYVPLSEVDPNYSKNMKKNSKR